MCGIEVPAIQKRLLAKSKLTLKKAMEIALAMETVEKNAETLKEEASGEGSSHESRQPIHGVFQPGRRGGPSTSASCYRCGQKSHKATSCLYKEAKCYKCGKVGKGKPTSH